MVFHTGTSINTKTNGKHAKKKPAVLRQKTLSSYFFQPKKGSELATKRQAAVSDVNEVMQVIDLEKPDKKEKGCVSKAGSLFDSQGSFDECDPDEEFSLLTNAPQIQNFKRATITRTPSFQKSNSSIHFDNFDLSESPKEFSSFPSTTRQQIAFGNNPNLSFNESARPAKRATSPTAFAGLRLTAPKRIKPISRKSSNLLSKTESFKLTKEQDNVIDMVVKRKFSIFYTGSAGTGKSVLLKSLIERLRGLYGRDAVAITASTGLAGTTIGGITLHKWSGVGLGLKTVDQLATAIQKQHQIMSVWRNTKVLIIDEISMIDGALLDKLETLARKLRKNEKPFGGIQLILTGDFFQLPPVKKSVDHQHEPSKLPIFCFESKMWHKCIQKTILLTKVFRQQDDELVNMLNSIRFGEVTPELVRTIKGLSRDIEYKDGITPTELYATRREVEMSNARQLNFLPGKSYQFESVDAAPKHYMSLLDSSVMVEKILTLKNDAQVMMLKNKPESELVNGSLGRVLFFITERLERLMREHYGGKVDEDVVLDMRIVSEAIANPIVADSLELQQNLLSRPLSRHATIRTLLNHAVKCSPKTPVYPYVRWALPDRFHHELMLQERFPVDIPGDNAGVERNQLPLMLCWALSIHKAQGQTIQRLKVDLRNIFEAGQVYVALSRAVSRDNLQVLNFNPNRIRANEKVKLFYKKLEVLTP
ncbi:hypothetical protein HG535_0A04650 [Zygotorulaspora mrakii]|uniref:ATP-dependent DNA helicase RRM3 n=1 Tax=Zygotorulaspora mrakii TaxID=42260 RepID=A0A7H9AW24_ZYGMR|nr:uncharacterized protein HG535_0A04650 [Zygotorulaspora mrakii]QLG70525.1 hypothetical protein HG535_0A04650 [Zygotorulaspora mrakii]